VGHVPPGAFIGNGSTVVGATDSNGNTILNQAPLAIGRGAHAGPGSIAIGTGAGAGASPTPVYAAAGAEDQLKALKEITDTADRICGAVSQSGQSTAIEISGDVKAELSRLAKILADLGIAGTGKITTQNYEGVLQQELSGTLRDIRQCKLTIFSSLKQVFFSSPPSSPSVPSSAPARDPNALYQYGEPVVEGQGGVVDQAHGIVRFQGMRTAGKADPSREFEYQDWIVRCPDLPTPRPNAFYGPYSGLVTGGTCTLIGRRN
jgi:hypothetical protein